MTTDSRRLHYLVDAHSPERRVASDLQSSEVADCVIVGGGPAGLTAAMYLRRFLRDVRIIDAGHSRANRIRRSHNVAGYPQGIAGPELLSKMERHLIDVGGAVTHDTVVSISSPSSKAMFEVELVHQRLCSRTVLICTGVRDRWPSLPGLPEVASADLLRACPVCDGYEFAGRSIAVLGDSLHSAREAAFVRGFSANTAYLSVGPQRPSELEVVRELVDANVPRVPGTAAEFALTDDRKVRVTMSDGSHHRFDVVYVALGVDPCIDLVQWQGVDFEADSTIVTDNHGRTNLNGLYAAGDVVRSLHQISVSVGQAAIVATAIHNDLRQLERAAQTPWEDPRGDEQS